MKRVNAYSFHSPMRLREMLARLNELGPWEWYERDNDSWGPYIATRALVRPDRGSIKILVDEGLFVVDFVLEAEADKLAAIYDTLFTHLLPGVGATKLTEVEHFE